MQRPEDPTPTTSVFDVKFNRPVTIQPAVGAATNNTVDASSGDIAQESRGSASITYKRDVFGNVVSTNNGLSSYSDQYNSDGLLTNVFDLHNPEIRTYDNRGRLVHSQFASGRTVDFTYDDYDRVLVTTDSTGQTTTNVYDIVGRLIEKDVSSGGEVEKTYRQYDDRDRLVSTTDALGRKMTFGYDPVSVTDQPISITDPAGRITRYSYDKLHRLIKRVDFNGGVTTYTYDNRGNLTSLTNANGNVTSFAYDRNDRKIRETRPSASDGTPVGRTTLYFYDAAGRLLRELTKSAIGETDRSINYEYDDLDRVVHKVVQRESPNGVTVDDDSTYTYENLIDTSLMVSAVNGIASTSFANETAPPFALVGFSQSATQEGNPLGLLQGSFSIVRDVTGEIASILMDGATVYSKTYDAAGRLIGSSVPGGFSNSITWDGFNRQIGVQHSDGTSGTFQYDLLNRITSSVWTGPTPISEQIAYDLAGNITHVERESGISNISYDSVNQLLSSTGLYSRTFSYDLLGNRLQDSANGPGSFVSNFLTSNGTSSFTADPDGFGDTIKEVNGSTVKTYGYRADDLLNAVQVGTMSAAYYFDALGRRVAKIVNTNGTSFSESFVHLGSDDRILMAKGGDGTISTFIDAQGEDKHLAEVRNGMAKAYVTDHLGSVLNSDAAGPGHNFGLFGETVAVPVSATASPVKYGYAGRELDETGLYYNRAREYSPNIGRFISPDRLDEASGGTNPFGYASNNPLRNTDPQGLAATPTPSPDVTVKEAQQAADMLAKEAHLATIGLCNIPRFNEAMLLGKSVLDRIDQLEESGKDTELVKLGVDITHQAVRLEIAGECACRGTWAPPWDARHL